MALSNRKKTGIGFLISGAVFIAVGIIVLATATTPTWVSTVLLGISAIAEIVGLAVTLPNIS